MNSNENLELRISTVLLYSPIEFKEKSLSEIHSEFKNTLDELILKEWKEYENEEYLSFIGDHYHMVPAFWEILAIRLI